MRWGISFEVEDEEHLGKMLALLKINRVANIGYDVIGKGGRRSAGELYASAEQFVDQARPGSQITWQMIADHIGKNAAAKVLSMLVKNKKLRKVSKGKYVKIGGK